MIEQGFTPYIAFVAFMAATAGGILGGLVAKTFWKIDTDLVREQTMRMIDRHYAFETRNREYFEQCTQRIADTKAGDATKGILVNVKRRGGAE